MCAFANRSVQDAEIFRRRIRTRTETPSDSTSGNTPLVKLVKFVHPLGGGAEGAVRSPSIIIRMLLLLLVVVVVVTFYY